MQRGRSSSRSNGRAISGMSSLSTVAPAVHHDVMSMIQGFLE